MVVSPPTVITTHFEAAAAAAATFPPIFAAIAANFDSAVGLLACALGGASSLPFEETLPTSPWRAMSAPGGLPVDTCHVANDVRSDRREYWVRAILHLQDLQAGLAWDIQTWILEARGWGP